MSHKITLALFSLHFLFLFTFNAPAHEGHLKRLPVEVKIFKDGKITDTVAKIPVFAVNMAASEIYWAFTNLDGMAEIQLPSYFTEGDLTLTSDIEINGKYYDLSENQGVHVAEKENPKKVILILMENNTKVVKISGDVYFKAMNNVERKSQKAPYAMVTIEGKRLLGSGTKGFSVFTDKNGHFEFPSMEITSGMDAGSQIDITAGFGHFSRNYLGEDLVFGGNYMTKKVVLNLGKNIINFALDPISIIKSQ